MLLIEIPGNSASYIVLNISVNIYNIIYLSCYRYFRYSSTIIQTYS